MFISVECTHTFNVPRCSRFGSPFSCVSLLRAACVKVRGFICGSICAARVFFRADSGGRGRPSRGVAPPIRAAFSYFGGFLWRPCRTHTHTHTRVHTYTHTHTHTQGAHLLSKKKAKNESRFMAGACCCCLLVLTGTVGGFIWALQSMTYPGEVPRGVLLATRQQHVSNTLATHDLSRRGGWQACIKCKECVMP